MPDEGLSNMLLSRIYYPSPLQSGTTITFTDAIAHRLTNVLRLRVGEKIILFNGQGGEFNAYIEAIHKKEVIAQVREFNPGIPISKLTTHLLQGISRGERMDYTIQKATELGVSSITPIVAEYCQGGRVPKDWQRRCDHWQAIMISASEQSGRCDCPILQPIATFTEWLQNNSPTNELRFIFEPGSNKSLKNFDKSSASVILLIGPESGFSDAEVKLATANQFIKVNLGPRILRTETVAPVVLGCLQVQWGDMG